RVRVVREIARNLEHQPDRQQMNREDRSMPERRVEAEQMVVKPEPDERQRPIVSGVRQVAGIAEPELLVGQRLPQKRPVAKLVVFENQVLVVERKAVAE